MKTMAEVLAEHQWYDATSDNEDPATGCTGCDDWFGSEDALDDGTFATHQADHLSAAGFGLVADAKAEALEEAAVNILTNDPLDYWSQHLPEGMGFQEAMSHWLKAHAAAVSGEG